MNRKVIPFIGNSSFTKELKDLVHRISQSNASVLLVGERGTGKRLFAQHLHCDASDDFGYFFEVNCKSFSQQQILSAFTAVNDIVAYNQRITLYVSFLDELSEEMQIEFLRLIDNGFKKGLNLKLVCSVEDSLEPKVSNGLFSADLYYRLNAIVLNMIPLNQRKDDILPIAEKYLLNLRKKSGYKFEGFSEGAKKIMIGHVWTGNVDELINAVQRAFIVGTPPVVMAEDLGILQGTSAFYSGLSEELDDIASYEVSPAKEDVTVDRSLKNAMNAFKKDYITKILEENGWNQTKTAKILGIQRTYVIRLMNELQIRKK